MQHCLGWQWHAAAACLLPVTSSTRQWGHASTGAWHYLHGAVCSRTVMHTQHPQVHCMLSKHRPLVPALPAAAGRGYRAFARERLQVRLHTPVQPLQLAPPPLPAPHQARGRQLVQGASCCAVTVLRRAVVAPCCLASGLLLVGCETVKSRQHCCTAVRTVLCCL